jgi:hypothetical protein
MIERLRTRWRRVSRHDIRDDCAAFRQRYATHVAQQCHAFDLADHTAPSRLVLVTLAQFSEARYVISEPNIAILGLGDWKKHMAPPSIVEFIVTLLIRLSVGLLSPGFLPSRHLGTKGCLFDFNIDLNEVKFKVLQGSICQPCRGALAQEDNGWIADDLVKVLSREWIGKTSVVGSPASIVANLGHDLFITKGFKPGFWQTAVATLQKDGTKELIKVAALILGAALLVLFGLKEAGHSADVW